MTFPSPVKYALIAKETTWGTGETPDKDLGLIISDISNPNTREVTESKGISSIETQKVTGGIYDYGVTVSGDFQHGRLLEYVLDTVAHVETTSDWKHTFTISNTPPSGTIETGNNLTTDSEMTTDSCLIESSEVSIEGESSHGSHGSSRSVCLYRK